MFRQGLAATVECAHANVVVEQFDTLGGVLGALESDSAVAFVLLDLQLPDSHGLAGLLTLKCQFPELPIAVISAKDDRETVGKIMACGAAGFISKAASVSELTAAVKALVEGRTWFPEAAPASDRAALTPMQIRIVRAIQSGLMNKQIAHELGISVPTVKYHLAGIFRKLGVQTRSQLSALARERFAK